MSLAGASAPETMRADRPYEPYVARHGRQYLYAFGTVAVAAFVVAAYVHSHRSTREIASDAQVTQGSIAGSQSAPATLAQNSPANAPATARATAPTHDAAPPASMPTPVAVPMPPPDTAPAAPPVQPGVTASLTPPHRTEEPRAEIAQGRAAPLKSLRDERTVAVKREAGFHADIARNIAIARASLDKNNLRPARRAIMAALAEQPGNGEALTMQAELVSREQERDSLLGYARLCARQADWVCAWHNAGHALTIDGSNSEARDLLSRAMVEQNAKGERAFDPSRDTQ